MSQDKTDCSSQAAKIALISGVKAFITTLDPVEAVREAGATYAAAKSVCEITKNDSGSSANNNSK